MGYYIDVNNWKYSDFVNHDYDCDYKRIGDAITEYCAEHDYQIKTDIDHLIDMVTCFVDDDVDKEYSIYDEHRNVNKDNVKEYLFEDNISSFDYWG